MPQFNLYPPVTDFANADIFLVYRTSTGSVKRITGQNLVASIKSLMSKNLTITVISSATTLSSQEFVVFNSGSTFTATLPDTEDNPGKPFYLTNKGAGTVTIVPAGTDTIAGETSFEIEQYKSYVFIPDGIGMWHVFSTA